MAMGRTLGARLWSWRWLLSLFQLGLWHLRTAKLALVQTRVARLHRRIELEGGKAARPRAGTMRLSSDLVVARQRRHHRR
jgi:hypothetical protein